MRVRMKMAISGTRDGADWPRPGETLDVPDDEGAQLCAGGLAEPVVVDGVETAVAPADDEQRGPLTTANAPTRRGRARKG